jgi:hypothetical protein
MVSSNVVKENIMWLTTHSIIEEDHREQIELYTNEENTILFHFMILLGFLYFPRNKLNFSHMETNNIIMVIRMEYERSNEYKCKSTNTWNIHPVRTMDEDGEGVGDDV